LYSREGGKSGGPDVQSGVLAFVSEVEDLLLPGGLGWKVLLLLAGLVGSLQAALLEVLEPGSHRGLGALCRPGGRTGTLAGERGSGGAGEQGKTGWPLVGVQVEDSEGTEIIVVSF